MDAEHGGGRATGLRRASALAFAVMLASCGGSSANAPSSPTPAVSNPTAGNPTAVSQHTLQFQGVEYQYFVWSPAPCGNRACPALLLAHGSGGSGTDLIGVWKDFASQNGIVLVGPTLALGSSQQTAAIETRVPQLFPALVEDSKKWARIDSHRVYLFGYSAGGYTVFDAATLASTYFAAGAVFAAVVTPDYDWIVQGAQRKTAIALYLGDHDQFFSLEQGRRTRDLLASNGFPIHYVELLNQDHNLATAAAFIERDAWAYMEPYSTP
jgi:poly(3-hydroxybutyrate) depolymerase